MVNISNAGYNKFLSTWWMLKITYGLVFIAAGADKYFNFITDWTKYISPMVLKYVPLELTMLSKVVGVVEICIGLLILSNLTRLGAYLAALWLLIIIVNLLSIGNIMALQFTYLDIVVRDFVMAVGACALGCLTDVKHMITVIVHHAHKEQPIIVEKVIKKP